MPRQSTTSGDSDSTKSDCGKWRECRESSLGKKFTTVRVFVASTIVVMLFTMDVAGVRSLFFAGIDIVQRKFQVLCISAGFANLTAMDKQQFFDTLMQTFRPNELTLGIEQEFFLYDPLGNAASHELSQRFLVSFRDDCQAVLTEEDDPGIGRHTAFADVLLGDERVRFKYDHHPHLMEIELPPVKTVEQMTELLAPAMNTALRQAERLGLVALFQPFLPEPVDHAAIMSEHSLCVALRDYRKQINTNRPEILKNPAVMNFSACIAATHFHIGGISWEQLETLMNGLYCLEPEVTPLSWQAITENPESALQQRWSGYQACLGHFPLVAFPDLPQWTRDDWFAALCRMPFAETSDNHRGGTVDRHDPMSWFRAKRDVSLIKPRHYGTIEFRVDPCQPTAEAVAKLCAARLATVKEILAGRVPARSFRDARNEWLANPLAIVLN